VADAVKAVLGVDVDRVLLEGVQIDKFADLAHTRPDRPTGGPGGTSGRSRSGNRSSGTGVMPSGVRAARARGVGSR